MDTGRAVFVAQRRAESGGEWHYGSGFLVGGRLVLTAAHVVDEGRARIQQGAEVYDAEVLLRGDVEGGTDLALLTITDPAFVASPASVRFSQVDRSSPRLLENCWAVGFPVLKVRPDRGGRRDTAQLDGTISPAANRESGELELRVTSTPQLVNASSSPWEGISGAVVFCPHPEHGDLAVGVVAAHPLLEGSSSLSVTPITAIDGLADREDWWESLDVGAPDQLIVLPEARRAPSRYLHVVDDMRRRTPELLDRDQDLADLIEFARHASGYRRLVGRRWSGKTALLSHLVEALSAIAPVDVVACFLSRRHGDADSARFASIVVEQLAALTGTPAVTGSSEAARQDLLFLWRTAALAAEASGRKLVLVVDGLDEDQSADRGLPSVVSTLPTFVNDHTCVIVSTRPSDTADLEVGSSLRPTTEQFLTPSPHVQLLEQLAAGELQGVLRGESQQPPDVRAAQRDVLALLAAAEGPLSAADLAELTEADVWEIRRLLTAGLSRVVETSGETDDRVTFAHDSLRERATIEFQRSSAWSGARRRVLTWAATRADEGWLHRPAPKYVAESYPGLLARTDPEQLSRLLNDLTYLEAAVRTSGAARVLEGLRTASLEGGLGLRHPVLTLLSREAKNLSNLLPTDDPATFLVQLRNRARMLGLDGLVTELDDRLDELEVPHLRLRWRVRAESPALERSLIAGSDPVRALALTSNGQHVVSADGDALLVWSVESGIHDVVGQQGDLIWKVHATPDGRRALVTTHGQDMSIWDLEQRTRLCTLHQVHAAAVGGNSRFFVAAEGQVRCFDADGVEQPPPTMPPAGPGAVLAADSRGTLLVLGDDTRVCVSNLSTGQTVTHTLGSAVRSLALSATGSHLAVGTHAGTVYAWDPTAAGQPRKLAPYTDSEATRVQVSDTGLVVASYGSGGVASWDAATGELLNHVRAEDRLSRPGIAVGDALALTPDGRLAIAGLGAEVVVMETARRGSVRFLRGHGQVILDTAVTSDGSRAFSASEDYSINVWDLESAEPDQTMLSHDDSVSVAAVDPRGRLAATGAGDGIVRVWDLATGSCLSTIDAHDETEVSAIAWDPNGGRLVTAGWDHTLRFWSAKGRALPHADLPFVPDAIAVTADGGVALASAAGDVAVHRRRQVHTLRRGIPRQGAVVACHLSADGRVAILSPPEGRPGLVAFDVASGTESPLDVVPSWNQALADGGEVLAVPRADHIDLWDIGRDRRGQTLGSSGPVRRCSVSGSPGVVVSGSWDRTLRAWAVTGLQSGQQGHTEPQATWFSDDEVTALAISRDGRTAVAGTNSGAVVCLELRLDTRTPVPREGS